MNQNRNIRTYNGWDVADYSPDLRASKWGEIGGLSEGRTAEEGNVVDFVSRRLTSRKTAFVQLDPES